MSASSRLRAERERLGLSQRAFAARVGISKNTQSAYETGGTDMTIAFVESLARHGVRSAYVLTGDGGSTDVRDNTLSYDSGPGDPDPGVPPDELVAVREIDLAYGMGGTFADLPVETRVQHFSRDWLRLITTAPPDQLVWTRGRGDSMGETIRNDDLILINLADNAVRDQDLIWAFTIGDIAMIKRLRIHADQVTILSDNKLVPPDTANHDDINIVGRVIFIGRKQ